MNRPRYVLADEPTGNLDSVTGQHVLDTLFGLIEQEGMGLVIVTHNEAVAARCRRQLVLRDGKMA
jgi:putative ABC transport system ATP-binding protein